MRDESKEAAVLIVLAALWASGAKYALLNL
jgi:hypothetical protein